MVSEASLRLLCSAAWPSLALLPGCDIKVDDGKVSVGVSRGRASDEWVRSYPLAKGGRFEIANENGQIEVRGTHGGRGEGEGLPRGLEQQRRGRAGAAQEPQDARGRVLGPRLHPGRDRPRRTSRVRSRGWRCATRSRCRPAYGHSQDDERRRPAQRRGRQRSPRLDDQRQRGGRQRLGRRRRVRPSTAACRSISTR